ncbi:MAG: lycopene cyclase domain-containing protein [Flavobacteriaceae bacterium]|nr:lycopene cyclase domain-containing protein [Bacteroidia bacterium]MBT8287153.1 lycopene cyclase domain-containing protein [Bacteroidia bacterium]NNF74867.1 lycopene cyclase domain-containing protein [Flavobacteriaceae bacterium]NNK74061.1 lycopene cyclase domain-containing protein [Flavobacteriaceae bacterium]
MESLYLLLNLGSISIPFLFSFHPKLRFFKLWKGLFLGIVVMMLIFIPWDIIFTSQGFWGFNPDYYLGIKLFGLPLEEWLFFICIPYACVFTHYALQYYFPDMSLSKVWSKRISYTLMLALILVLSFYYERWYTLINYGLAVVLIPFVLQKNPELLRRFYITFLVMLIPFFIVNGVLTGSFIDSEVVWYNNDENLGIRMFTIPIEDSIYAFSMILICLYFTDLIKPSKIKKA